MERKIKRLAKISSKPNPVDHNIVFNSTFDPFSSPKLYSPYKPFTSNYNPFTSYKLNSPKGKTKPNENENNKHSIKVIITENNTSLELPSFIKCESNSSDSYSDCNSDESNPEVVDVEADELDDYSDDEILDSFEDDHLEVLMLEEDLKIPLSVLRLTSIKAKIYSSQLSRREKLYKKLPLEVFSLFILISIIVSIIINNVIYYFDLCSNYIS